MTGTDICVFLAVQYDGTDFCGSQAQPGVRTVQGTLTDALFEVLGERPKLIFASRTDAGVHAMRNVASAKLSRLPYSAGKLADILNARLPRDLAVTESREAPTGFHPRFQAIRRDYAYRLYRGKRPDVRYSRFSAHYPYPLDIQAMNLAAQVFIGEHDFSEFCIKGAVRAPACNIVTCEAIQRGNVLTVRVSANRFLRRMVCFMVGSLVDVGSGRRSPAHLAKALTPAPHSGFTNMPGHGLTLLGVRYPDWALCRNFKDIAPEDIGDNNE